jgi:predicted RNA-binding protein YlxR (DUF448 family)
MTLRFLPNDPQYVRFWRGESNIITDAQQHGFGRSSFLNYDRPSFILDPLQQLAEMRTCTQCRNHDSAIPAISHF